MCKQCLYCIFCYKYSTEFLVLSDGHFQEPHVMFFSYRKLLLLETLIRMRGWTLGSFQGI